jgi:hypothetical protein
VHCILRADIGHGLCLSRLGSSRRRGTGLLSQLPLCSLDSSLTQTSPSCKLTPESVHHESGMANPLAIEKTERLLQDLRDDDGSPARKTSLLRQVEEIRTSLQSPPEIANFYIKKASIPFITYESSGISLRTTSRVVFAIQGSMQHTAQRQWISSNLVPRASF